MTKILTVQGDQVSISDGYHTFEELYDNRNTLWIALCKQLHTHPQQGREIWRSIKHSDGTWWPGWFVLGMGKEKGRQMTYHLPVSLWDECGFAETLELAPEFDWHQPKDVLERLKELCK